MMTSIIVEPGAFSFAQINEFMDRIIKDLVQDEKHINEFMKLTTAKENPQVYMWLI